MHPLSARDYRPARRRGDEPDRGHERYGRVHHEFVGLEAAGDENVEDMQRLAAAVFRPPGRSGRDQPAADAARLVDYARQGQSGDPRSRQSGGFQGNRKRFDDYDRLRGRPVGTERHGTDHRIQPV